ncbi:MAG: cadherin-like domain-containing protein [Thiobacillus sp.]
MPPIPFPRRPLVEELEPRLLFSADLAPVLVEGFTPQAEQRLIGANGEFSASTDSTTQAEHARLEVVFIDLRVQGYDKILADIQSQNTDGHSIEVVLLDAERDGVVQIGEFLSQRQDIDAVHLISHGSAGSVQLGAGELNFDSLLQNASSIKQWGNALTSDADILIYGCDLASTEAGTSLINALGKLTGADVAASDDKTGTAKLGGDWILEYQTGIIQAQVAVSEYGQQNWDGVLVTYTVTNTNDTGAGSLRDALAQANTSVGVADTIDFNINGTGSHVITHGSALTITDTVTIDATTDDSFAANGSKPAIILDGNNGTFEAFVLTGTADGSAIRGFVMRDFNGDAIEIQAGSDSNTITGNYIGSLNESGTSAGASESNALSGVYVLGSNNTITGNVLSGNTRSGIEFAGSASGNIVIGNYIGTDATGTVSIGNTRAGVYIDGTASNNVIGGAVAGSGNLIANNGWDGIRLNGTGTGNTFQSNTIYGNTEQGIDIGGAGITANDGGDGDTGGNNLQNFPSLSSATTTTAGTTFVGFFNGAANATFRIDFYTNRPAAADGSGYGEAERYLGYANITTDGSGNVNFNTLLANVYVNYGDHVTATATSLATNDTSEFSSNVTATASGVVVVDTTSDVTDGVTTSITNLGNNRGADGRISLREAIAAANATANGGTPDKIVFGISGYGAHTINLTSLLPAISEAVTLDASTDDSFAALGSRPAIVLNGAGLTEADPNTEDGLRLWSGSSNSTIRGLIVQNFSGKAIDISGSDNNLVAGNWVGLNSTGTAAAGNKIGVNLWNASNNIIGGSGADRNVISGNTELGVNISGSSTGNHIRGNYIGTDRTGMAALGNLNHGIYVESAGNTIGGTTTGYGNVISGTVNWSGMTLGASASNTLIAGNLIGLNATGTAALGNNAEGVFIYSANNTIGGITADARNIISGNGSNGITLYGAAATGNVVIGNYIGTDKTGTLDMNGGAQVNGVSGVIMVAGASNNRIGTNADGSNDAAERNVISGNNWYGVEMLGSGTSNNVVQGNYIGTDVTGLVALGNAQGGVAFWNGATNNQVGSGLTGSGNVISGNETGVLIANNVANNKVQGNIIGLGADGSTVVGNTGVGVYLYNGGSASLVTGNLVGTDANGSNDVNERNLISGNYRGIALEDAEVTGNTIAGNYIGTDATGLLDRGNSFEGVYLLAGAHANTIGGSLAAQRNVISGNNGSGIEINGEASDDNIVRGNWIGVTSDGAAALGNGGHGVYIFGGADNTLVGGTGATEGNWIASPALGGVFVMGDSSGTVIQGNRIGTNLAGTANWGTGQISILLENGANHTLVGGTAAGAGNIVAYAGQAGIFQVGIGVINNTSTDNSFLGNTIFNSFGLGIDLGNNGITANDLPANLDADTGPNASQNFPVLYNAAVSGTTITITGEINSTANTTFRIEFFNNPSGSEDASGYGEGRVYLGSATVTTNASGVGAINVTLTGVSVNPNDRVSSTATVDLGGGNYGSTSEFSQNVIASAPNQAPSGTNGTITAIEDTDYVFTTADFGFSDADGNTLDRVWFTTLPAQGTLKWNGSAFAAGNFVSAIDIASGLLTYTPPPNASGAAYTSFTFQVQDNGGTVNGGVDTDQSANTLTINVTAVNDAPTGVTASLFSSISEDNFNSVGKLISDFTAATTDPDTGALKGIYVHSANSSNGQWQFTLDGSNWVNFGAVSTSNALLLPSDAVTRVRFVPNADYNGVVSPFAYGAWDQTSGSAGNYADASVTGGSTAFGGTGASVSITVNAVNDEQVLITNTGTTVAENSTGSIITTAMLATSDVDHAASQLIYTLTTAPTNGTLRLNGSALVLNDTFTQADINAGLLTYDHNGSETASDSFGFSVDDGVGSASTGTFVLTVTPANDSAPTITSNGAGANAAINVAENSTAVTTVTATDADLPAQSLSYSISGGADAGLFTINSSSGALSFLAAPDRELATDAGGNHVYDVIVQVSDGTLTDTQAIAVTVTDVDEFNVSAPVDVSGTANAVNENAANGTAVGITAFASDADATTNNVSYSLFDNAAGRFAINASTGVVTVADGSLLDRETAASHNITVHATSADGSIADSVFTIAMGDVDEFNVGAISDTDAAADAIAENATNGTVVGITGFATDADATTNTITYSLDDTAGGRFAVNSTTGVVTVANGSLLDYEAATSHSITLRASSADGSFTTLAVSIAITPLNDNAPTITSNGAGNNAAISVAENTTAVTTVTATDADLPAQTLTYSLSGTDAAQFSIDANTGVLTFLAAPDYDNPADSGGNNVYNVTVQVSDGNGGTDTQTIAVTVSNLNDAPVATITPPTYNATEQVALTLSGTGLSISDADAGGASVQATLSVTSGLLTASAGFTGVGVSGSGTATLTLTGSVSAINNLLNGSLFSSLSYTANSDAPPASATLTLSVDDLGNSGPGGPLTGSDTATITITPVNDAPQANNVSASGAEDVASIAITLTASDIDGSISHFRLANLPANGTLYLDAGLTTPAAALTNYAATTNALTLYFKPDAHWNGSTNFSYTAFDNDGAVDLSTGGATLTVTPVNDEQVLITNTGTTVAENSTGSIITTAMLATSDVDHAASQLIYTLTTAPTNGTLRLNGSALVLNDTFTQADINAGLLTYDHNGSETASDSFGFSVDDGVGSVSAGTFVLTVTPANDSAPTITSNGGGAATAISLAENSTAVTTVTATDADLPAQTLTYSISGGADAGLFTINSSTGALSFVSAPDRELATDAGGNHVYDVIVQVSDGALIDTQAIAVTVTDVDEFNVTTPADINGSANAVNENAANGSVVGITGFASDADATTNTMTYSLTDNAGGRFAIDANTGVVTVANSLLLDREAAASHNITVRASSADGSTADTVFTINLSDVDEFDVTTPVDTDATTNTVNENAANGSVVGVTALASDADATTNAVTYSLANNDGGRFSIDGSTGVVRVAGAIDREADGASRNITVRATSADGSFTDQVFAIAIGDVDEFDTGAISDSNATVDAVAENATIGTVVGVTAFASDADATTNTITYSLTNNDGGRFAIDSATGVVTVAGAIDREIDGASRNITVRATSVDGSFDEQIFSIGINDIDEFDVAPITDTNGAANTISENAANGSVVGITAFASDADATNNGITYSLDNDAGGRFTIDGSTGVITVANGALLDYEAATNHAITVRAASSDGSSSTLILSISVTPVNDNTPTITSNGAGANAAINVAENSTAVTTVTATDADLPAQTLTYTISGGADAGLFTINNSTGALSFTLQPDFESPADIGLDNVYEVIVEVSDGTFVDTQTLSVTVMPVNDNAPVSTPVTLAPISEDSGARLITQAELLSGASDADGNSLTANGLAISSGSGTLVDNGNGTWTYTPALNDDTAVSFSYTVTDGSLTAAGTATMDITPVNDAPVVSPITLANLNEDTARLITQAVLLAGTTDVDGDTLNAINLTLTSGSGTLIDNGNGTWTFTPAADWSGAVSFGFDVSDGTVQIANTASLTIDPVNDAPIITTNQLSLLEGETVVLTNAHLNSSDVEQNPSQRVFTVSSVVHGQFEWAATPGVALTSFTQADIDAALVVFVHDASDFAPSYDISVSDGTLTVGPQAASITFTPVNEGVNVTAISGTQTTEAGGTLTFDVSLNAQPFADVTLFIASGNVAEGTASVSSLTFTAANWNSAQQVTVTGVDDAVDDGDQAYSLQLQAATSADRNYNGLDAADLALLNLDDDGAGVLVTPASGLVTDESGVSDSFSVVLTSQPLADVVINLSSSDTSEGVLSTSALTFTAANWNLPQSVTVTGVDDLANDGNVAYQIVATAALSADPLYNGISVGAVSLTNQHVNDLGLVDPTPDPTPDPQPDPLPVDPDIETLPTVGERPAPVAPIPPVVAPTPEISVATSTEATPSLTLKSHWAADVNDASVTNETLTDPDTQQLVFLRLLEIIQASYQIGDADDNMLASPIHINITQDNAFEVSVLRQGVKITAVSLSVGAVWWALRAGGLFASLLTSLPAWRSFDVLPVLNRDEDDDEHSDWDFDLEHTPPAAAHSSREASV